MQGQSNLQTAKEIFLYRNVKIAKIEDIKKRAIRGREFFHINRSKPDTLIKGAEQFIDMFDEYANEVREIRSCDSALISLLETVGMGLEINMSTLEKVTDAGDLIPASEIIFKAKKDMADNPKSITPTDLWVLTILKDVFKPNNIEVRENKNADSL